MVKNYQTFISFIFFGVLCTILLGLIFFGFHIFNFKSPLFQFIPYSLVGSLSFYLFHSNRNRDAIFVNILLFFVLYFLAGRQFFLTHLLYFAAVVFSVYFYSGNIYRKMAALYYARPLVLSGIFSILSVFITVILFFIYFSPDAPILPFRNMPIAFLIGLGLGSGFELSEYFVRKAK